MARKRKRKRGMDAGRGRGGKGKGERSMSILGGVTVPLSRKAEKMTQMRQKGRWEKDRRVL
jgi:hypothetical protein